MAHGNLHQTRSGGCERDVSNAQLGQTVQNGVELAEIGGDVHTTTARRRQKGCRTLAHAVSRLIAQWWVFLRFHNLHESRTKHGTAWLS